MSRVYLVNVGANMSHKGKARSPIFNDGLWVYVSFPTDKRQPYSYSDDARPFVRPGVEWTHADPVWDDFTYGDKISNPRGRVLKNVERNDVLLFWGLLWENEGRRDWDGFTGERGWYLLGALRVEEFATSGQRLDQVSERNRDRAKRNPHYANRSELKKNARLFFGAHEYSNRFTNAVDLEVKNPSGLMYRAFTSAPGELLALNEKPAWSSSLRSVRTMWDLQDSDQRRRATLVRDAIRSATGYDLLRDL